MNSFSPKISEELSLAPFGFVSKKPVGPADKAFKNPFPFITESIHVWSPLFVLVLALPS